MTRLIELTEYRPCSVRLSPDELAQLTSSKLLEIRPTGEDGVFSLTSGSEIGTVVWGDLRLLIKPKVQIENVFFLLSFAEPGLTKWRTQRFPYARSHDLLQTMARLLMAETRAALPHGLARDYRRREETLTTLRGRIDIGRQLSSRPGQSYPLECVYEEFTEDVALFQVIKAAHRRVLRFPGLDREVQVGLQHALRRLGDVSDVPLSPAAVPELRFNRLNEHWEPAGRLAELILRRDSVRDRSGSKAGASFIVDMNKLFEHFMEHVVRQRAREHGLEFIRQAPRQLSASISMKPDFVLRTPGVDRAVGDAKYKHLDVGEWKHHDLYQALAYATALRLDRALLVYAESEQPRKEIVHARDGDFTIEITGVDLSGTRAEIMVRASAAADRLVAQAQSTIATSGPAPMAA